MNKILLLTITILLFLNALVISKQNFKRDEENSVRAAITPKGSSTIARYSPAIEYQNNLLFVSGQIPYVNGILPDYTADGKNDLQEQTTIVMNNIRTILDEAGYSFEDALKVSVFLTDIQDYQAFNEVYANYWNGPISPPAREVIEVGNLPGSMPGYPVRVEVSLIAGR